MNVLSLFDGCSGGQQALDRLGMKVDNYYASEIDKYAIQVTMANYPNTIQLGSVVDVDVSKLPKIDLLCGGSPCQSFSFAGKRKGMSTKDNIEILTLEHYLQLRSQNFEFEGQSYLFWEYMRILSDIKKVNPDVKFLLENVMMGEKWQRILTQAIGINPIEINSSLLSAQNRRRLYWTNIGAKQDGFFDDLKCAIIQPKDKGILLKDVLEKEVAEKYYLKTKIFDVEKGTYNVKNQGKDIGLKIDKSHFLMSRDYKGFGNQGMTGIIDNMVFGNKKLNETINKHFNSIEDGTLIDSDNKSIHKNKSITITTRVRASNDTHIFENENQLNKFNENVDIEKHNTLTLAQGRAGSSDEYMDSVSKIAKLQGVIRRLTPIECERLQTVKDNYTAHVSDSQRYKMLGNGWTIDVIAHIFSFINK